MVARATTTIPNGPYSRTKRYYVAPDGSNANDGLSEHTPFRGIDYAVDKANTDVTSLSEILVFAGDNHFTEHLQPKQGCRIKGFSDNGSIQGCQLVYDGPDDGQPWIKTTNSFSRGQLSDFNLVSGTQQSGGANAIELFNPQNGAICRAVTVGARGITNYKSPTPGAFGFAFTSDDSGTGYPGFLILENCWAFRCLFLQTLPLYTSLLILSGGCDGPATGSWNGAIEVLAAQTNGNSNRAEDGHITMVGFKGEFILNTLHFVYAHCAIGLDLGFDVTMSGPSSKSVVYMDAPLTTADTGLPIRTFGSARGFANWLNAPQQGILDPIRATGGVVVRRDFSSTKFAPHVWEGTHGPITAQSVAAVSPGVSTTPRKVVAYPGQTVDIDQVQAATLVASFTAADSASAMPAADTGQAWTNHRAGIVGISSNKAYNVAAGTGTIHQATCDAGSADGTLQVDFTVGDAGSNAFILFRATDGNNNLFVDLNSVTDTISLKKYVSGTPSNLVSAGLTLDNSTTYQVKVICSGVSITVQVNGSTVITYTLTGGDVAAFSSPTRIGIGGSDSGNSEPGGVTGTKFDNLSWTTTVARFDASGRLGIGPLTVTYGAAAPTTGAHIVGEQVLNTAPAASGNIGWVCVAAGTPGTWKTFGAIAA